MKGTIEYDITHNRKYNIIIMTDMLYIQGSDKSSEIVPACFLLQFFMYEIASIHLEYNNIEGVGELLTCCHC